MVKDGPVMETGVQPCPCVKKALGFGRRTSLPSLRPNHEKQPSPPIPQHQAGDHLGLEPSTATASSRLSSLGQTASSPSSMDTDRPLSFVSAAGRDPRCPCGWQGTGAPRAPTATHGCTKWLPSCFLSKKEDAALWMDGCCPPRAQPLLSPGVAVRTLFPRPRGSVPCPSPPRVLCLFQARVCPLPQGPELSLPQILPLLLHVPLSPRNTLCPSRALSHAWCSFCLASWLPPLPRGAPGHPETLTPFLLCLPEQREGSRQERCSETLSCDGGGLGVLGVKVAD
nr:PREDICTED: uncharacterized protein LOC109554549 isoform X1 [Bos indicus]